MTVRLSVVSLICLAAFAQDGAVLYKQRCAPCHETGANRAPAAATLKQMTPEAVQNSLLNGSMAMMGMGLSTTEVKVVATHVTGKAFGAGATAQRGFCATTAPAFAKPLAGPHWNGWGVDAENHRFQPAAMARLTAAQTPRLKLKWAFAFPNASRANAQPAVAGGRLFVGSAGRQVFSLDAATGCIHWAFELSRPHRDHGRPGR
jgi:polyvinyl alcohol dehydrogenase (cytochrome)